MLTGASVGRLTLLRPDIFAIVLASRSALTITANSVLPLVQKSAVVRLDGSKILVADIDEAVTRWMKKAHVTGVGIAVINDSEVAYLKTYGARDTEKHLPLTPDSIMTAAPLTKPAFATMVMQLVHEGIVDLNKPVYEYLPRPLPQYPAYTDLANDPRYKQITMRMLLDHTSGFQTGAGLQMTKS
jgi:CubicO group peptidase (beta-lactamase class C family)